jgi:Undecaprenyl-phosphate galactose phosphotransferase WbaP
MHTGYEQFREIKITRSGAIQSPYQTRLNYWRLRMRLILLLADILALLLVGIISFGILSVFKFGPLPYTKASMLFPGLLLLIVGYSFSGLYQITGTNQVEEIRRIFIATIVTVAFGSLISLWAGTPFLFTLVEFFVCGLFVLAFVPASRWLLRAASLKLKLWGEPVAVIGEDSKAQNLMRFLRTNPTIGLNPVLQLSAKFQPVVRKEAGVASTQQPFPNNYAVALDERVQTAIIANTDISEQDVHKLINKQRNHITRVLLVSDYDLQLLTNVVTTGIEDLTTIEVSHQLRDPVFSSVKRVMDVMLVLLVMPIILPLLGLIALLVSLDSPGAVFYRHERIGRGGKSIMVWKIRTMVINADEVLQKYLNQHAELRKEWAESHKLKDDPRVTRIGKFLRKTSLDELPQLYNILRGDMSLVGPRPIVSSEIKFYGNVFGSYKQVRPGLTGLWQISGRNNTNYETRVQLDQHYVKNWSIWLDIYILVRTVFVVLLQEGAY